MAERVATARPFAPVVGAGLALGGLAALASSRPWFVPDSDSAAAVVATGGGAQAPVATALALVVLASWGVLLVTRGWVRRAVALLGFVAGLVMLGATVWAWITVPTRLRSDLAMIGALELGSHPTAWYVVAAVAGALGLVTLALAWQWLPGWPEMGRRYDAPGARPVAEDDASSLDLWKALDEGRDPTDGPS
ncbi:MAG: Trp biosynthesis-associated membrane protein [Nocardioidaceae bacterium]